ncbi:MULTISPECIES: TetR/AcrR family transcriptional regulator [unclassified Streptomyces]|uniref:TetR/AcrR family transcriptional regulator n=1 Tax=unclassified Streptomyces TaxID=2593676 RepID=UPI00168B4CFA|nr:MULTISPECIES: TetR/AcrR family transcriptional regulator [unclassified Streptomyces]MBD3005481.1 TetR/AcrR family transcriptional regulator [Streptomyces sp. 5-10]
MNSTSVRRIEEIGEESRRRILDAAEELFAEKGFDKTSFVDIAARSGISRGSIPWHFKNKDGLLLAVVDRANQRYLSLDHFSDRPALDEVLEQYVLLAREAAGRLMFSVLTEALSSEGAVREEYQAHNAEQRRRVAHWLKVMGVRSASTRESLATAITGSVMGVSLMWQIDPDNVDIEAACKALAAMVHRHIGA